MPNTKESIEDQLTKDGKRALWALRERDGQSLSNLAWLLGVSNESANRVLHDLMSKGLVYYGIHRGGARWCISSSLEREV